ncbi:MAG: decaprenyl-phosphate phosphoribosyltransferase [bacterium]|nr:decaprenyl-phosphate phosphoribosyltransferase [bacterium]
MILRLLRVRQWVKNLLVFAPLFFAQKFTSAEEWQRSGLAFLAFCFTASAIYIFNDIRDIEDDRQHPVKKHRPIAAGQISSASALLIAILLMASGFGVGYLLNMTALVVLVGYAGVMIFYSIWWKHIQLLDVLIIAGGITSRAILGADAIEVEISHWLLVCTFLIALMLALTKRRQELARYVEKNEHTRRSLENAPPLAAWDHWIAAVGGITILAYTLYTVDRATIENIGSIKLLYTVPIVAFAIFRYQLIVYTKQQGEDPTETLLGDKAILIAIAIWFAGVLTILMSKGASL